MPKLKDTATIRAMIRSAADSLQEALDRLPVDGLPADHYEMDLLVDQLEDIVAGATDGAETLREAAAQIRRLLEEAEVGEMLGSESTEMTV